MLRSILVPLNRSPFAEPEPPPAELRAGTVNGPQPTHGGAAWMVRTDRLYRGKHRAVPMSWPAPMASPCRRDCAMSSGRRPAPSGDRVPEW